MKNTNFEEAFSNIIGYKDVKAELKRISHYLSHPDDYLSMGIKRRGGLLLLGEPGTGKTTLCQSLIKASGRRSFVIRKDNTDGEFVDKIGDTFKAAEEIAKMENEYVIVFLDDFDKFSNEDEDRQNTDEMVAIQTWIDNVKNEKVFVIATANSIRNVPCSLLRAGRFDTTITIPKPCKDDSVKIVEYYLSQKPFVKDIDAKEIAAILDGRSCAELETVVNEAVLYSTFAGKKFVDMEDIIRACLRIIFNAPLSEDEDENPYLINIAYHECGHGIVNEILEPGSVNLVTVYKNDGNTGGITSYNKDEYYSFDKEKMENRVTSLLAGKAALELYGIDDTGCTRDISRAFGICDRFIDDYCSFGFGLWETTTFEPSSSLREKKEHVLHVEMERYYQRAKKIIIENHSFFNNMVKELLEKKVLLAQDIQRIKQYSNKGLEKQ